MEDIKEKILVNICKRDAPIILVGLASSSDSVNSSLRSALVLPHFTGKKGSQRFEHYLLVLPGKIAVVSLPQDYHQCRLSDHAQQGSIFSWKGVANAHTSPNTSKPAAVLLRAF